MIMAGVGLPFLASSVLGPWADAVQTAAFGLAFLASQARTRPCWHASPGGARPTTRSGPIA
jgi:hypothetical protein